MIQVRTNQIIIILLNYQKNQLNFKYSLFSDPQLKAQERIKHRLLKSMLIQFESKKNNSAIEQL
ncbi:hypothetical protein pb186bvf_007962 [Paramecium bursaria]